MNDRRLMGFRILDDPEEPGPRYPLDDLKLNEAILVEDPFKWHSARSYAWRFGRKTGREFKTWKTREGVVVKRTK